MREIRQSPEQFEYYKKKDFPEFDGRSTMDDVATPQPRGDVEGKPVEKDPVGQEREQQLETWMSDIKAFIRNIDISKL